MAAGLNNGASGLALGIGLSKGTTGLWGGAPGLVSAFATLALSLNFLSGSLDSRITFARSTTATFVGSNGLIQTAAINAPRFDYDPVTLAPRGLLIEEARTNLLTYSEQFDNAAWTKTAVTITPDATVSPSGATDADLVTDTSTSTAALSQSATIASGAPYAQSLFLKRGNTDWVRIVVINGSDLFRMWVNLATGALGSGNAAGSGTYISASSTAFGNGWYRITLRGTLPATTATVTICTASANASSTRVLNGTYYAWGAQLEAGTFSTSYIPTVASALPRSADDAAMTGANFSSWFNATQGTFVSQFTSRTTSGTRTVLAANDGTSTESIRLRTVGTDPFFTVTDGGVDQANIDAGTVAAGTTYRMAGAYAANDFATCIAGGAVGTDTSGTVPAVTQLVIGNSAAGEYLNGHICTLAYYPVRLPDGTLQALAA